MKANKGITLIPLIILIIIMLILLGISIEVSRNILEKSKAEKLLAYMQLIEIRANAYYEELDFKIGAKDFETYLLMNEMETLIKPDEELKKIEKNLENYKDTCSFIKWDKNTLVKHGIDNTFLEKDDEYFIVSYVYAENLDNSHQVQNVYYNKGIYLSEIDKTFYSLSELKKEMDNY